MGITFREKFPVLLYQVFRPLACFIFIGKLLGTKQKVDIQRFNKLRKSLVRLETDIVVRAVSNVADI